MLNRMGLYSTDAERWQAVVDRDAAADGRFLYAVKTTHIYCRPTCPSRRPKREHAVFYPGPQEAEAAGYRACRRCRPDGVSRQQRVVARVQGLLETVEPEPTLSALAEAVGLSPSHLQRTFKRATGLSPKQYALARREARFKGELQKGKGVTTAMYDAGYGSSGALYKDVSKGLGMKPKTYQGGGEGERISFGLFDSSLGRMLLAATHRGVVALRFGEDEALRAELHQEFPAATLEENPAQLVHHQQGVNRYLDGTARTLELPLNLKATAFQARVWEALQSIPYGETRSYSEVAQMIGQPTAARAVARACATNPVALVVPCHRVVRAGGGESGYRWGLERKRALLNKEQKEQKEQGVPGEQGVLPLL